MRTLEYKIPEGCSGMAVKTFARSYLGLSSRVFTRQKFVDGGLAINGERCRSIDILNSGDILSICIPDEKVEYPAVDLPIDLVFENEDYLVINKASHMPIHPSPGHDRDSLLNGVAYYYQETGQAHGIRPLYRLDKDTSGLVILGKHRAAVSSASLHKRYYAVCQGMLSGSGTIDIPVGLMEGSKIVRECGHGVSAVTHWKAIESGEGHTLLSLILETGRTHQIRVHFSGIGHPLAGDDLYGGSRCILKRQALHCGRVWISCPVLSIQKEFQADFPEDMRRAFPWLPQWKDICKEELLCPHV